MPSITVIPPTERLAFAIERLAERRRNSGIQKEIPPHREGEHGESECRGEEGRIFEDTREGGAVQVGWDVVRSASLGFTGHKSVEARQ